MSRPVLLVDDDVDVLDAMRVILRAEGYDVRCASGGIEALAILAEGPPPVLVITDVMMPDLTGWDILECMRADSELGRIPVVITTASFISSQPDGVEVLEKPFSLDDLLAVVSKYCANPPDGNLPQLNRAESTDDGPIWAA